jgi:tetratricopeptide (TPR) repeat protein
LKQKSLIKVLLISLMLLLAASPAGASRSSIEEQLKVPRWLFQKNRLKEAARAYEKFLGKNKLETQAWQELARVYVSMKDFNRALKILNQLIVLHPKDVQLRIQLAQTLLDSGQPEEALKAYEGALNENPDNPELQKEQARMAQTIVIQDVRNVTALSILAHDSERKHELDVAARTYRRILELKPDSADALAGFARVVAAGGDIDRSDAIFKRGIRMMPNSVELRLGLAENYEQEGLIDYAVATLRPLSRKDGEVSSRLGHLRSVQIDEEARSETDSDRVDNRFSLTSLRFRVFNSRTLQHLKFGYITYRQPGIEPIQDYRAELGSEGEFRHWFFNAAGGADQFKNEPTTRRESGSPEMHGELGLRFLKNQRFSATGDYERYSPTATTVSKRIMAQHVGAKLSLRLTSTTEFAGFQRWGKFSDDNREFQTGARLQQILGPFFAGANYSDWKFAQDPGNGYFAPNDQVIYAGQMGFMLPIWGALTLRAAGTEGKQILDGLTTRATGWEAGLWGQKGFLQELNLGFTYSQTGVYILRILGGNITISF